MEPGERHREHVWRRSGRLDLGDVPQWSPVNVTGNTSAGKSGAAGASFGRNGAR